MAPDEFKNLGLEFGGDKITQSENEKAPGG
jgi:hypothetical protein